jgi:anthranilate phosphoribosyltransferase
MIENVLKQLAEGTDLSAVQAQAAFEQVMRGACTPVQIASLLTALRVKGETVEELVGAARALRQHATLVETGRDDVLDTCGTGGDETGTLNISTAAALVAAAAGAVVAKHGNRSVSSASGSSELLEGLGVRIDVGPERVAQCIRELGFGFCFAPVFHGAMRHAAPVRKELRFRTIFNLAGPLANPAQPSYQLLGVARPELVELMAGALQLLGTRRAAVVCGSDGMDEVTLTGPTSVCEVAGKVLRPTRWQPADFGLAACRLEDLKVDSPGESVEVVGDVLAGRPGPPRDVVLANAAAALWVAEKADSLVDGVQLAAEAVDHGKAARLLARLVAFTNEPPS